MSRKKIAGERPVEQQLLLKLYAAQLDSVGKQIEGDACDVVMSFMEIADKIDEAVSAKDAVKLSDVRANIAAIVERLQMFDACVQRVNHVASSCERLSSAGDSCQELEWLRDSYSCAIEHETHDATVERRKSGQ